MLRPVYAPDGLLGMRLGSGQKKAPRFERGASTEVISLLDNAYRGRGVWFTRVLPLHPALTAPIAAAFVLAPAIIFTLFPSPVILMNNDIRVRGILISFRGMPTHWANAGDIC
jgi:hypothetical protein